MNSEVQHKLKVINEAFEHFNVDIDKFLSKNNNSASVRARKALLEIGKLSKEIRKLILEVKKENK